jgi:hypothetical protein
MSLNCGHQVIYENAESYGEIILTGKPEELGKNLSQRHFVHHKSHMARPERETGPPR